MEVLNGYCVIVRSHVNYLKCLILTYGMDFVLHSCEHIVLYFKNRFFIYKKSRKLAVFYARKESSEFRIRSGFLCRPSTATLICMHSLRRFYNLLLNFRCHIKHYIKLNIALFTFDDYVTTFWTKTESTLILLLIFTDILI